MAKFNIWKVFTFNHKLLTIYFSQNMIANFIYLEFVKKTLIIYLDARASPWFSLVQTFWMTPSISMPLVNGRCSGQVEVQINWNYQNNYSFTFKSFCYRLIALIPLMFHWIVRWFYLFRCWHHPTYRSDAIFYFWKYKTILELEITKLAKHTRKWC